MLEILEFIFRDFWTWLGFYILFGLPLLCIPFCIAEAFGKKPKNTPNQSSQQVK